MKVASQYSLLTEFIVVTDSMPIVHEASPGDPLLSGFRSHKSLSVVCFAAAAAAAATRLISNRWAHIMTSSHD